tara:strand:- start:282292 stop:283113 length:822 start_codon:yes stop_codon:yes gene_type:complete
LQHCHYLEIEGKIAATIALYKTHLIFKGKELPVTFIGGIAVNEEFRGHGVFKMFFSKLLNEYHKTTALFILWTGDPEIYEAWEFFPFGYICEQPITNPAKTLTTSGWNEEIQSLIKTQYNELSNQYIIHNRSEKFWKSMFQNYSAKVFTNDEQTEYAICSKGFDLRGICHESTSLKSPSFQVEASSFWSPEINNELAGRYMGFLKLSNIDLLNEWLKEIGSGLQLASKTSFLFNEEVFNLSQQEVIQGIFGPAWFDEIKAELPPIWIGGLDSI